MLAERQEKAQVELARGVSLWRYVPSLYAVGLVAILGAILVVASAPRIDTDLWWHLKVGQYIANHHVVPSRDFMSFTFSGHAWTDHEWLAELALFGLYQLGGLWGPILAFAGLICATFSLVYAYIRIRGVHPVVALFVTSAAFIASSASWGPRIQMLTLFFLSLYSFLLARFEQTKDRRILAAFPAIMLIWANVHGGFVLGLVLLVLTLAGQWLNRLTKESATYSGSDLRAIALALSASVAVTVINPNTYRELLYPLTFILPNAYTNLIEESASPNFHLPVMMVFEAMLLLLVAAFVVGRPRLNFTHLFIVLAFTHLAFSQVRNVAIWAVLISPLLAYYLQVAAPALRALFPRTQYTRRPVKGHVGAALNLALLLLVVLAYTVETTKYITPATLRDAEQQNYPVGAVAYLKAHSAPRRVFESYPWGGYLLWEAWPRYGDYMDSRADTLFNTAILRGYLSIYTAAPDWKSVMNHYAIQDVLVERAAPIAQVLAGEPGWKQAYRDSVSVLFVRR